MMLPKQKEQRYGYWLCNQGAVFRFLVGTRELSLLQYVQTSTGTLHASYAMVTWYSFPRCKVVWS